MVLCEPTQYQKEIREVWHVQGSTDEKFGMWHPENTIEAATVQILAHLFWPRGERPRAEFIQLPIPVRSSADADKHPMTLGKRSPR